MLRPALQKKMHMVDMAFHCKNFNLEFLAFLPSQFFETVFKIWNKKYLTPILWTEYEMIVYEGHCSFCPEIYRFHVFIIACM